jgi:hypothetical protein
MVLLLSRAATSGAGESEAYPTLTFGLSYSNVSHATASCGLLLAKPVDFADGSMPSVGRGILLRAAAGLRGGAISAGFGFFSGLDPKEGRRINVLGIPFAAAAVRGTLARTWGVEPAGEPGRLLGGVEVDVLLLVHGSVGVLWQLDGDEKGAVFTWSIGFGF